MNNIGLIDDRRDQRETTETLLNRSLRDTGWRCISIEPFSNLDQYFSWINEHEIAGLIVDEKLNESQLSSGGNAGYDGHTLVRHIRQHIPDFPVYSITSYKDDPNLQDNIFNFENIFDRTEFQDKKDQITKIILRGCQKFTKEHQNHLSRISELSTKNAISELTEEELSEIKSIQTYLSISLIEEGEPDFHKVINQIEEKTEELAKSINSIKEKLK